MDNAHTFNRRLSDLLAREHSALGDFLVELAEFDRQRLWVELGYPSLFDYLHRELGLSKASASFRKKAAELIQRFPDMLEPLRDGRLCLSSVYELAKVLTPENREEVLPRFFQLSKRDAKAVAAALLPAVAPPQRDMVTAVRLPVAAAMAFAVEAARATAPAGIADGALSPSVCPDKLDERLASTRGSDEVSRSALPRGEREALAIRPVPQPAPGGLIAPTSLLPEPSTVDPLTAVLNRLHVTVSRQFLEKLDAARAALSHSHPGAGVTEILEAGLDLILDRQAKRNGVVKKPRKVPRRSSDPNHVPAHVRREVWIRDDGKCQWPLASGGICGSKLRAERHHVMPRSRGGPPTAANLITVCKFHHDLATRREFGDAFMDRCVESQRVRTRRRTPRHSGGAGELSP